MATPTAKLPLEQARACAQQAIDLLLEHDLAPTPINYAVAFEYQTAGNSDLRKVLDDHLRGGKPLDEFLLRELYERHLAADRAREFNGMHTNLQGILQTLMQQIGVAGSQSEAYRARLEHNIEQLGDAQDPEALRAVAGDLLDSALTAQQDNQSLQTKLDTARQEAEQLREELQQQRREALIDPLTGLFNRRALEQHVQDLWSESQSESRTLSVLSLDIDHFKRINDTYGHAVGDVVIRHVADTVRKCIRGDDIAVRFGGEEFLVLLPDTPLEGAVKVAETIRGRIEALRLTRKHDNLTLDPFTISLGVAIRCADDSHESLFERADQALYQSKSGGRNRVTVWEALC